MHQSVHLNFQRGTCAEKCGYIKVLRGYHFPEGIYMKPQVKKTNQIRKPRRNDCKVAVMVVTRNKIEGA